MTTILFENVGKSDFLKLFPLRPSAWSKQCSGNDLRPCPVCLYRPLCLAQCFAFECPKCLPNIKHRAQEATGQLLVVILAQRVFTGPSAVAQKASTGRFASRESLMFALRSEKIYPVLAVQGSLLGNTYLFPRGLSNDEAARQSTDVTGVVA